MNIYLRIFTLSTLLTIFIQSTAAASCTSNVPLDSVYNVKDSPYNAVGNGITDDTAAIQCAIDDAITNGGGQVYLPIGQYAHTGLTISENSVHLVGAAETGSITRGTRLIYTLTSGTQLFIGGSIGTQQIHVKNLTFLSKFEQTSGEFIKALGTPTSPVSSIYFEDLAILGHDSASFAAGYNGILLDGINVAILDKIKILGLKGNYAVKLAGTQNKSDVFRLSKVLYNSLVETSGSLTTDGLVIADNVNSVKTYAVDMLKANRGFVVGSNEGTPPRFIYLLDVTTEFSRQDGIIINSSDFYTEIKNCYTHVNGLHGINIQQNAGPVHISGCSIQRNGVNNSFASGIWLAGENGGSVTGNYIADNHNAAVYVTPTADGFAINSNNLFNTVTTNQNYGVVLNNGSQNNAVTGNIMKNNATLNINIGAVINTIVTDNVQL